jgi:hypothetical protein
VIGVLRLIWAVQGEWYILSSEELTLRPSQARRSKDREETQTVVPIA